MPLVELLEQLLVQPLLLGDARQDLVVVGRPAQPGAGGAGDLGAAGSRPGDSGRW